MARDGETIAGETEDVEATAAVGLRTRKPSINYRKIAATEEEGKTIVVIVAGEMIVGMNVEAVEEDGGEMDAVMVAGVVVLEEEEIVVIGMIDSQEIVGRETNTKTMTKGQMKT